MDREELYKSYLEKLRLKLIAKYDELGLRASGKYADELEAEVTSSNMIMWGSHHSRYIENGRDKGPDDYRKIAPFILQWIETKQGLPSVFYENKESMSFAIAHKIANEGIKVPNQFNKGEVVSSVVNDFLANDIQEMIDIIGENMLGLVTSNIVELFNELV